MAGEALVGASGIAVACARPLTTAAPASTTAERVIKFRRESIWLSFLYSPAAPLLSAATTAP